MKTIIGTLAAITCSLAAPLDALAIPTYAWIVARDHCEYLAAGWHWDDASSQALRDNIHWLDEMNADGPNASRVIALAIRNECPALNSHAFANR